ncbi:MAG: hypothetical protein Q8K52_07030 [Thiobacillus sp.]|nr:hypothetical protein [Thiobacillus sp.]
MKYGYRTATLMAVAGLALAPALWADDDTRYSGSRDEGSSSTSSTPYTSGATTINHPGRLLASNCFQCHGTNGHGMASLAGKSASSIVEEMNEMRQKPSGTYMMYVHARGYTPTQIKLIADYLSKQQP